MPLNPSSPTSIQNKTRLLATDAAGTDLMLVCHVTDTTGRKTRAMEFDEFLDWVSANFTSISQPFSITYSGSTSNALDVYGLSRFRSRVSADSLVMDHHTETAKLSYDMTPDQLRVRRSNTSIFSYDMTNDKFVMNNLEATDVRAATGLSVRWRADIGDNVQASPVQGSGFNCKLYATFSGGTTFSGSTTFGGSMTANGSATFNGQVTFTGAEITANNIDCQDIDADNVGCSSMDCSGAANVSSLSASGNITSSGRIEGDTVKADTGLIVKYVSKSGAYAIYNDSTLAQSNGSFVVVRNTSGGQIVVTVNNNGGYVNIHEDNACAFLRVGSNSWVPVNGEMAVNQ